MKTIVLFSAILIVFVLTLGNASAQSVQFGFGMSWGPLFITVPFGVIFAPPPVVVAPPAATVAPPPPYYPAQDNHSSDDSMSSGDSRRVWVPGHWETQQTARGWERVYVLGYWEDRP